MIVLADAPTPTAVVAKVREIAAETPDFNYRNVVGKLCRYIDRGADGSVTGSCIVGRALVALGVPANVFEQDSGDSWGQPLNTKRIDYPKLRTALGWDLSAELSWLHFVQVCQDAGETWGNAIGVADRSYSLAA